MKCLQLEIFLHEGRYHGLNEEGRAEWPPSPARLFQALVAAASKGSALAKNDKDALEWLAGLAPPVIAAPAMHPGQSFSHFMPNNDLDAKGGDPLRIGEVRSATKPYHPHIFDAQTPILYLWSFEDDEASAIRICEIAEQLYQLGRGVDMAWATGELASERGGESRLDAYPGAVYRPALNGAGSTLSCPAPNSLTSLIDRYKANQTRLKMQGTNASGKKNSVTFAQPPKPRFIPVAYASPATRFLYELRDSSQNAGFHVWPLRETCALVKTVRDDCAARLEASLAQHLPDKAGAVNRVFGLCRDMTKADKLSRIRIIPLPSIGHPHADRGIRRILVETPPNCPIRAQDIDWAFIGFCKFDQSTGEVDWMLTKADEPSMLNHYGIDSEEKPGFHVWHTITPMALSIKRPDGRTSGAQRTAIEIRATSAIVQALRHAGLTQKPASIRVQREPFDTKGALAQEFAADTRFDARCLWHVELSFAQAMSGPLLVGNGRYLGLGLMIPVRQQDGGSVAFAENDEVVSYVG